MTNQHPGIITFVDGRTGKTWEEPASDIAPELRFVSGIPVVKVVSIAMEGNKIKVCEYGPDGRLLQTHHCTTEDE